MSMHCKLNHVTCGRRYEQAAKIRDSISDLRSQVEAVSAAAAEQRGSGKLAYTLGQRVLHSQHGYRAIVCGSVSLTGRHSKLLSAH